MKINPHIFRGYDLRGVVDIDLTPEIVEHLGKVFGTYMKRQGASKMIISRDCRQSSPEFSKLMIKGLNWAGIDTVDIGMHLVGTFYWSQYHLDCSAGVYVSASHNPPEFNGFKFANDFSETLVKEGMDELRRMALEDDIEEAKEKGKATNQDITQEYFDYLKERLEVDKKFKVVVDPGYSTAGALAPDLLRQAGCEVIEHNTSIDPSFPLGTADPTESAVAERLSKEVTEAGADIGFTYDSDGDRIGIVDEQGGIIWNDVLVAIFAIDVLNDHPGAKIMYNTLCSKTVPETIEANGGEPFMWRTGHSFLKKKNQEVKAAFIGELSGHFFFSADYFNHDDGLYSTLRLLQFLSRDGRKLSEVVSSLPQYISSPEIKVFCADERKIEVVKEIAPMLREAYPDAEIIDDERAGDGIRLDLPKAMFVVRYSQNGPYLTIKFEAKDQATYDELKDFINKTLRTFDDIDWESSISVNIEALV